MYLPSPLPFYVVKIFSAKSITSFDMTLSKTELFYKARNLISTELVLIEELSTTWRNKGMQNSKQWAKKIK